MTTEPHRLQYLEAMGLTAWVARYRLPNAQPTEACEWEPEPAEKGGSRAPGERLHALLEDAAEAPSTSPESSESTARPPAGQGRARALLGDLVPGEAAPASTTSVPSPTPPVSSPAEPPAEALRFTWQVTCLDGRWLLVLPRDAGPSDTEYRLLGNLLRAAGVVPSRPPSFETFRWPQLEGLSVEAPLEEAQEGLRAFLNGRRQRGWVPERLLVFGGDAVLSDLLVLTEGHSGLLSMPVWQGPDLKELAHGAEAKRALWPRMQDWKRDWRGGDEEPRSDA
ncbi:hypothetical protein FZZ93_16120 [Halomonas eurihalina]|uniref:Energy transducer TonB n=1 Tax=Halomonas eurihalina TaxID=42566 RepID=A0A5D9CQT8_HALER|nr:hypothetical protein [Halomonas eurihalina]MDR5859071.1 hypothetical protein [Halomonas eurihalina]TZG32641.1 hypothetical protein FZZ93_16120 [Halomonas eurihalina]